MKKILSFFILLFFTFCFCQDEYLQQLKKKIESNANKKIALNKIANLEKDKFAATKDSLYYISYKYALLFTFEEGKKDKIKHFVTLAELWRVNNNKYPLIITDVNFSMALHFEKYSNKLSLYYLDLSIENELKIKGSKSLPHLYHVKGRLYYNEKNYDKANEYFTKALRLYTSDQYLFISSMYNNFGLVNKIQGKKNFGINEFLRALQILTGNKKLSKDEYPFYLLINENLTDAYYQNGNYKEAEKIGGKLFNDYKNNKELMPYVISLCKVLYKVCQSTQNKQLTDDIINYLKSCENKTSDSDTQLIITETILNYYFQNRNDSLASSYYFKVIKIKDDIIAGNRQVTSDLNEILKNTIIKNINQKYDYKIHAQRTKTLWVIITSIAIISFLVYFVLSTIKKRKNENEISAQQRIISEQNELILLQNVKIQDEKIKNLHLNLNLKQETAKAFLEKIKKARKNPKNNSEDILKELYFDLNNLVHIDKKNVNYIDESISENQNFVKKLSEKYPQLTNQELQLCVYFRLNLSAKEISMLEKITDGSVRVYKSKIKSKMGIEKEKSIEEFLTGI